MENSSAASAASGLSARLKAILSMTTPVRCIADIGADHGIAACAMAESGSFGRVIATDVSAPSLAKARALAESRGAAVECRVGDGLEPLGHGEADAAVIAGMGGELMADIITEGLAKAAAMEYLVLSPHTHPEALRRALAPFFTIERELTVREGRHFYTVIRAVPGSMELTEAELLYGADIYRRGCPLLADQIEQRMMMLEHRRQALVGAGRDAAETERLIELTGDALRRVRMNIEAAGAAGSREQEETPMRYDTLAAAIEKIAPPELALGWDNCGYNLLLHEEIKRALVCVDVTLPVVAEAVRLGCDTMISHHPLLFSAIKRVDVSEPTGRLLAELIRADINVYSAHTSFDCAPQGMNAVLAEAFGIEDFRVLSPEDSSGTIGELGRELSEEDFARLVKETLGVEAVKCSRGRGSVKRVAFLGGAGGSYVGKAAEEGADAFLTGEAKHHEFIEAEALGLMLVAAGHFDTEACFTETMRRGLQMAFDGLQYKIELFASAEERSPYRII